MEARNFSDENQTDLAQGLFSVARKPSPIQREARHLYSLGLNVFPLPYGSKEPKGSKWKPLQYARIAPDYLDLCFSFDSCNIAVMAGRTSGNLVIADFDDPESFKWALHYLRIERQLLVWASLSTRTEGVGHIFFRLKEGAVKNAKYKFDGYGLTKATDGGTVDLLGENKYAVLPPSYNKDRKKYYQWYIRDGRDVPVYSLEDILPMFPELELSSEKKKTDGKDYGQSALDSAYKAIAEASIGNRNNTLNNQALGIGELVFGGVIDESEAEDTLIDAATSVGLSAREARETIKSAFKKSMNNPRTPPTKRAKEGDLLYSWLIQTDMTQFGRKASSVRSAVEAMAELAYSANKGMWRATRREIEAYGRLSSKTVLNMWNLLEKEGVIVPAFKRTEKSKYDPSLWKLGPATQNIRKSSYSEIDTYKSLLKKNNSKEGGESTPVYTRLGSSSGVVLPPNSPPTTTDSDQPIGHDAAERGALGKHGWLILNYLQAQTEPKTRKEITEALSLTTSQYRYVLRSLKRLNEYAIEYHGSGFLNSIGRGWTASRMTEQEFDSLIEEVFTKVVGKGERRMEKLRRDREVYAGNIVFRAVYWWHTLAEREHGEVPPLWIKNAKNHREARKEFFRTQGGVVVTYHNYDKSPEDFTEEELTNLFEAKRFVEGTDQSQPKKKKKGFANLPA